MNMYCTISGDNHQRIVSIIMMLICVLLFILVEFGLDVGNLLIPKPLLYYCNVCHPISFNCAFVCLVHLVIFDTYD